MKWSGWIGLMLPLAMPASVWAQPLFASAISLDSTVMNCDAMVIGRIVEFNPNQGQDGGPRRVAIEVAQTLKGAHRERITVELRDYAPTLAAWKDKSAKLLVAVQDEAPRESSAIHLDDPQLEMMTADLTVVRGERAVIEAVEGVLRRWPGVRRIEEFRLAVRDDVILGTGWEKYYRTGGYLTLSVPVDERLETRVLENIASDDYMRRKEGATALRFFKSDPNIERARALLGDDQWAYLGGLAQENMGIETHVYGVREAAYETLVYWGISVARPVIQERITRPDRVTLVDYSNRRLNAAMLERLFEFPNLQSVMLWNTTFTDANLNTLAQIKSLRELYLDGTRVTDEGLKALATLPRLEYVGLKGTRVTDAGIAELRRVHPDVKIDR